MNTDNKTMAQLPTASDADTLIIRKNGVEMQISKADLTSVILSVISSDPAKKAVLGELQQVTYETSSGSPSWIGLGHYSEYSNLTFELYLYTFSNQPSCGGYISLTNHSSGNNVGVCVTNQSSLGALYCPNIGKVINSDNSLDLYVYATKVIIYKPLEITFTEVSGTPEGIVCIS